MVSTMQCLKLYAPAFIVILPENSVFFSLNKIMTSPMILSVEHCLMNYVSSCTISAGLVTGVFFQMKVLHLVCQSLLLQTLNLISIPHVSTCCHQMCMRNSCVIFKESNFNLENDTVSKALSAKYRFQSKGDREYICKSCHQKLKTNTPQMPAYAVANMEGNMSLY